MAKVTNDVIRDKFYILLKGVSLTSDFDRGHIFIGRSYGRNNLLLGWDPTLSLDAAQTIRERHNDISEAAIQDELQSSIVNLFEHKFVTEDADPELDAPIIMSLFDELEHERMNDELQRLITAIKSTVHDWTAIVFLEGLELTVPELQIANSMIYPSTSGPLGSLLIEIKPATWVNIITQQVNEAGTQCHCYMVFDVHGEDNFARIEALRIAQKIVAIMTLYMVNIEHWQDLYRDIGVIGYPRDDRCKFIFMVTPPASTLTDQRHWSVASKANNVRYHSIEADMREHWQNNGLEIIEDCCKADENSRNQTSIRINNAVSWYCRSMNAISIDEQYVAMITALESLLVADEDVNITQRLADSVAMLIGKNFEDRKRLAILTKDLYATRCKIVHKGLPCSRENLRLLNDIVVKVILAFCRREASS